MRRKPAPDRAEEARALAEWRRNVAESKERGPALPAVSAAMRRTLARLGVPLKAIAALWGPP